MPNLTQSLQGRDIGFLRIVARLWGLELLATDTEAALSELVPALLDPKLVAEMVESLPAQARAALDSLGKAGGRLPWAGFARRFGEIGEAGPGRRDRELVYLHPESGAEVLFYRALLARAFFDLPAGAQEFAYIPDDLLPIVTHAGPAGEIEKKLLPLGIEPGGEPMGRPATPKERAQPLAACDRLLDDATSLLAALRMGLPPPETRIPARVLTDLLSSAGVIVEEKPQVEPVRTFLEAPRREALEHLFTAWLESETFNELRQVPGLVCEGDWQNAARLTRAMLLRLLTRVPDNKWWSLPSFIQDIKAKTPDFQRPAGDYDSWFIKRASDGLYLRGFSNWESVDGALIRYLVTGPLFWLGRMELASPLEGDMITAFRVVSNVEQQTLELRLSAFEEKGKLAVNSNGRISVPRSTPRAARYQIARFCEWEQEKEAEYRYRVTSGSLRKAGEQGLKVSQLLSLLAKNAAAEIPPAFVKALKRWELNGSEARVEVQTVLRVSRPELLEELRSSKAGRFLGEPLGPVTVVVKPGAQAKVLAALAELGLLAEGGDPNDNGKTN